MSGNRTKAGREMMPRSAAGSSVSFDEGVDAAQAVLHRDIECVLPNLRRFARSLTHDAVDANDLVQECLARALGIRFSAMRQTAIHTWQERLRDPSLTVLLILELCVLFVAVPLAAQGLSVARPAGETLVLAVVLIVVMLSHRRGAIFVIVLGLAATFASLWLQPEVTPVVESLLSRGGTILSFSALSWVVAHAVYAPGRITFRRLQGAFVLYLNLATIFASAYHLIWELSPSAFTNLGTPSHRPSEIALMLYFSFSTLTTIGFGDIVPVNPLARSLANLEAVVGQIYLATTVGRLVTLELEDRRRGRP